MVSYVVQKLPPPTRNEGKRCIARKEIDGLDRRNGSKGLTSGRSATSYSLLRGAHIEVASQLGDSGFDACNAVFDGYKLTLVRGSSNGLI